MGVEELGWGRGINMGKGFVNWFGFDPGFELGDEKGGCGGGCGWVWEEIEV